MLAGASLVLLPLTFGGGLVFAAMMVPWMAYQGTAVGKYREPSGRHVRADRTGCGDDHGPDHRALLRRLSSLQTRRWWAATWSQGFLHTRTTALKYLASGFGGAARTPWWQVPGVLSP